MKERKDKEQKDMQQYRVLIVEDDEQIRDGIEIYLKSQGYEVFKAGAREIR